MKTGARVLKVLLNLLGSLTKSFENRSDIIGKYVKKYCARIEARNKYAIAYRHCKWKHLGCKAFIPFRLCNHEYLDVETIHPYIWDVFVVCFIALSTDLAAYAVRMHEMRLSDMLLSEMFKQWSAFRWVRCCATFSITVCLPHNS